MNPKLKSPTPKAKWHGLCSLGLCFSLAVLNTPAFSDEIAAPETTQSAPPVEVTAPVSTETQEPVNEVFTPTSDANLIVPSTERTIAALEEPSEEGAQAKEPDDPAQVETAENEEQADTPVTAADETPDAAAKGLPHEESSPEEITEQETQDKKSASEEETGHADIESATEPGDGNPETGQAGNEETAGQKGNSGKPKAKIAPNVELKAVAPPLLPKEISGIPTGNAASLLKEGIICPVPEQSQEIEFAATSEKGFSILGAEVMPGTSARLAWSPGVSISGLEVPTPVLVVHGANPGPVLCLTAATHGDEINGIEIIRRVIYDVDPQKLSGKIIGIPIVNLQGFQRGSRYLPDRRDLNRYFPGSPTGSLASRVAYSLFTEVINRCNTLIDFHTGSLRRSNLPQVRADMQNQAVAKFTEGFDEMVVLHSPGGLGMLRRAAADNGIPAVTFEVGESLRLQSSQVEMAVKSVFSVLNREGMYPRSFRWGSGAPVYYKSVWLRADRGGILLNQVKLGDKVKEGDQLGTVTDPITNERTEITSPVKGRVIGMAVNQVVMHGYAAYHVGIEASEEDIIESALEEPVLPETEAEYINEEMEPEDE